MTNRNPPSRPDRAVVAPALDSRPVDVEPVGDDLEAAAALDDDGSMDHDGTVHFSHRYVNEPYAVSSSDSTGATPLNFGAMDLGWLKAELGKEGRSQAGLARHMGWSSASIANRVVSGDRQIKANELPKIHAYLASTGEGATLPHVLPGALSTPVGVRFINRHGKVEAGAWREVFPDETLEPVPVPDVPLFSGNDVFALDVVGPSMNEHYPDGSVVICRRGGSPMNMVGKHVVIERVDAGGKVETTLKELTVNNAGEFELWPRSSDERFKEPIRLDPADEREVRVIGRVIWMMKPVP